MLHIMDNVKSPYLSSLKFASHKQFHILTIFILSVIFQISSSWPLFDPEESALWNTYPAASSKFKFQGDASDISLEPPAFVDLRLRYILNQSSSNIEQLGLLHQEELNHDRWYKQQWDGTMNNYQVLGIKRKIEQAYANSTIILEAPEECHQALFSYSFVLHEVLNRETRELCSALQIQDNYNYKAFFKKVYLAMETLGPEISRIQNETQGVIVDAPLYRGVGIKYRLKIGQEITFQHFTSTTRDLRIAEEHFTGDEGEGMLLEIQPPIPLRNQISLKVHSQYSYEDEVLLSPLQSFVVHNITNHFNSVRNITQLKAILRPKLVA